MAESEKPFLDLAGLQYIWDKIVGTFVKKDGKKVLSDNNYSNEEKEKLAELHNYTLPAATEETLGGIRIGSGLSVDNNGKLTAPRYDLPVATSYTLGGIKIGTGVTVDASGTLNVVMQRATRNTLGGVRVGSGLAVDTDGVLSADVDMNWSNIEQHPTTLDGYGIIDGATKSSVDNITTTVSNLTSTVNGVQNNVTEQDILNKLQLDSIPGTTQTITFTQDGEVSRITHTSGQNIVRTDDYTFGENTVTEVRTLSTGQTLTIVTNTETLVTTLTYATA